MTRVTIDLIFSLAVVAIFIGLYSTYRYIRYHKGKKYEILDRTSRDLELLATITISWFFLDILKDGIDSPIGWWFLCFILGAGVCTIIVSLLKRICNALWPIDSDAISSEENISLRLPEWIRIAGQAALLLLSIFITAGGIIYLVFEFNNISIGTLILFISGVLIFAYGVYDSWKKLFNSLRRQNISRQQRQG